MGNMGDDADDMHAVIDFLTREYGYRIHCSECDCRASLKGSLMIDSRLTLLLFSHGALARSVPRPNSRPSTI